MAKNEEENTGYITQSTRHSMLVSLSREINVISDENAVLYDTIIEGYKFCASRSRDYPCLCFTAKNER